MSVLGVILGVAALALAGVALGWFEAHRRERGLRLRLHDVVAAERELRRVLDELPEAVLLLDQRGRVQSVNASALELAGRCDLVGVDVRALIDERDRGRFDRSWEQVRAGAIPPTMLLRLVEPPEDARPGSAGDDGSGGDGRSPEPVLTEATFHRARRGDDDTADLVRHATATLPGRSGPAAATSRQRSSGPDRVVLRLRDVSERERHAAALAQARRRFQQAFQSAPTGMALVRLDDGRVVDANEALAEMLGVPVADLIGRTLREFTHVDDVREAVEDRARLELGIIESYRVDQRFRRASGGYVWTRTRVTTTEDDGVMLAVTHIEDVTDRRRAAELLTRASRLDELTGLPNRAHLMQLLTERLESAPPNAVAVLFIDLDQFKVVNDSLGHAAGDEVLRVTAERLGEVVDDDDVLARFGGDEFVVVLDGHHQTVDVHEAAERFRRSVLAPFVIDDDELYLTVSIGYALNADPDAAASDLMRDADAAMHRAKALGRDTVEGFELGHRETSALALRTAGELRRGIERREIVPYFQPIVDLDTGRVLGYEVLARWLHPERGLLTPDMFLDVAEDHGLMVDLGAGILRDALAQLARWRAADPESGTGTIAVNVATRQLVDPAFYHLVAEMLAETGIDADLLWLEITETSLLADVKQVTTALHNLRSLGLHLSVDDFGTGYSSLTYLRRFPVEAIKIDRAFVSGLGLESDDTTIVDAVIRLGQALGLSVVAEGIETPLQLARLRELGCDRGQGYLFGRPRPAALISSDNGGAVPTGPAGRSDGASVPRAASN